MADATDALLLCLPAVILDHIADLLFASPCPHKKHRKDRPEGRWQQGLRSTAVLETCRELSALFEQAHRKALLAACAVFYPPVVGMASKLSLSRVELTRLLTLIKYYDDDGRNFRGPSGRDDAVDTIPWHYNPLGYSNDSALADLPLVAPFDPNLVHILVRVRLCDALLFSAHGTWAPQAPWAPDGTRVDTEAVIDLAMAPAAPTLTTPATLFGHPEGDECIGLGVDDAANDAWLRRTDVARAEQLGTHFSEYTWGEETQRKTCPATDAFQVDIRLVHVQPTCKKGEPRDMRWANLCTSAARFRTGTDCHETPSDGIDIEGNKANWRLSAALGFDNDSTRLFGESVDGIHYSSPEDSAGATGHHSYAEDSWLEVNVDLESTLQPWSSSSQVHAVCSASIAIVWQMSEITEGYPQPTPQAAMNMVPSRVEFEGDTHGWQV